MTTLLERPAQERRERARPHRTPQRRRSDVTAPLRVAALVVAAVLPFGRVFVIDDWFVPLVLAGVAPVAVSWIARRLRWRWWAALVLQALTWLWFIALVLLPGTLWGGLVPTVESVRLAVRVAAIGAEQVAVLPAPVYPEIPLLLLAATGVWWVATSIDVLALRLDAPGKAVVCATTLWIVPLAIVPGGDPPWLLATPLLLASLAMMLAQAERDFTRWGPLVAPTGAPRGHGGRSRQTSAAVLATGALLVGAVLAGLLPGFGDPPWYEMRGQAATTLTANPIVQLRTNLVATDTGPVMRVRSREPVYLRSTALDRYSEAETWESSAIEPLPLGDEGYVPGGRFGNRTTNVRLEVVDVTDGVLVPAPIGAVRFAGPEGVSPRYDRRTSTFTFGEDRLQSGQRYEVRATRARMNPDVLASLDTPARPELTALPDQVPPEVGRLAREIVDEAGAASPFQQALAIQNELRTWEYSLRPPAGHSGVAMRTFLEQRIGYCEQFAGTMAVMLRTLGVPARVAVGFTPGTVSPDDPTLWTVSWANAHAWVEVKFGGTWLAFEPTPRSDGNVLVPTVSDPVPTATVQSPVVTRSPTGDAASQNFDIFDERGALQNQAAQQDPNDAGGLIGGGGDQVTRLAEPRLLAPFVLLLLIAFVALVTLGRAAHGAADPSDRVLAVRDRIGRLGHGLGVRASPWQTDREYLSQLAPGDEHARDLAAAISVARYAPTVTDDVAEHAERAGDALASRLLDGHAGWQRAMIRVRGDLSAGWRRVRAVLDRPSQQVERPQRSSSSRRRRSWK